MVIGLRVYKMSYDNIERGNYAVGDKEIYFRSKWEANYALYLQWLKDLKEIKDWQYEPYPRYDFIVWENKKPRVLGLGYLPDFKVINNDDSFYLVELKGRKQGMQKLKRMAKYYPEIKIELVTQKEYMHLHKKLSKMLNFY